MNDNNYILTEGCLPDDGVVVETVDSGGYVRDLKYKDGLWWFPDMSMYVYFTPKFWRAKQP